MKINRYKLSIGIVVILCMFAGILATQIVRAFTFSGYNGAKILFESNRDGNSEVYTMNADGSGQTNLTNNSAYDGAAKWSPDGEKIVFVSGRVGNNEVFVMNADGTDVINISNHSGYDSDVSWSPDGTKILFSSSRSGYYDLYVANPDGSGLLQITDNPEWDDNPAWSADSQYVVYESYDSPGDSWDLWKAAVDGSGEVRLTNTPSNDDWPHERYGQWSPNDDLIAFNFNVGPAFRDKIRTITVDGSVVTQITPGDNFHYRFPVWSPDGTRLLFETTKDGREEIYTMNPDGTDMFRVTNVTGNKVHHAFSPDGSKILFAANTDGDYETYSINPDGTGLAQLTTNTTFNDYFPQWQPIPLNTPPVTTADSISTPFNTSVLVDVLANDSDEEELEGDNLSIMTPPTNGAASVEDGKIRYTPNTGYQGPDSLTYEICDSFTMDQMCSTEELSITVQSPAAPSVTVTNVNGEMYSSSTDQYHTSNLRPTFSGTATPGSEITVEIHSDPITLTTTADGNGNWSVTPTYDLPSGQHMVYISATLNGLTTQVGAFGLSIGGLATTGESYFLRIAGGLGVVTVGLYVLAKAVKRDCYSFGSNEL